METFVYILIVAWLIVVIVFILSPVKALWKALKALWKAQCPSCKKRWSKAETIGRKEIDRKGAYTTVTRYDITRDREGKKIREKERKEQIHVETFAQNILKNT